MADEQLETLPDDVEIVDTLPEDEATSEPPKAPETKPEEPQTIEENPIEAEARALGWQPKAEFDANPANAGKKWRSAELFMELTPLFEKIDSLHKQNKTLDKGLKALAEHNKKIEVAAYNRAKAELQAQRRAALEDNDIVKAEDIRDQIEALPKPAAPSIPTGPAEPPPQFIEWRARNRWYDMNEDARLFADTFGVKLHNSGVHPDEVLKQVEAKVRQTFPNLFINPKRDTAPTVESGARAKSTSTFQLTREEADVMNAMIRAGAPITREEYIAQLRKTRGA